jgi:tellurite resistance protein TerC
MQVASWVWILTISLAVAFLAADILVLARRPHEPSTRECVLGLAGYVGAAVAFGIGVSLIGGGRYGTEFFAGWLTEYSLSVDNLFVFLIIMAKLKVPRHLQQEALLIGIVLALLLRGLFIGIGAAAINAFAWVFYLFGAFLIYTAVKLAREYAGSAGDGSADAPGDYRDGRVVRWLRRRIPATDDYVGSRLTVRRNGSRLITPMLVVVVALGSTDLLFALDSIPAIYGLTQQPYLVLTANLFALMGLRQLYFLIGGLLRRLVYLSLGLSVLLAFIGAKLILHAIHENTLPFVNSGEQIGWAPDIPIWLSLVVIIGVLTVTSVASLAKTGRLPARTS